MTSKKSPHYRPEDTPDGVSKLLIAVIISIIGHLALVGMFVAVPKFSFDRAPKPRVINVNLVSLPTRAATPAKSAPAAPAVPKAPEEPSPAPPPPKKTPKPPKPREMRAPAKTPPPKKAPPKKAVSLAPKKAKPKKSLKKKTYKADRVVKSAVKRIEKKVEASRPDPVKAAIDRMRSAVQQKEAAGTGATGGASGPVGEKRAMELLDIYRIEIGHLIGKKWAHSDQMADRSKNLTAWVMIVVDRSGKIREFWFEKRSGDTYLDDSAARAIQKADPLPPFPEGVTRNTIHQGFRFTPSGIQ